MTSALYSFDRAKRYADMHTTDALIQKGREYFRRHREQRKRPPLFTLVGVNSKRPVAKLRCEVALRE